LISSAELKRGVMLSSHVIRADINLRPQINGWWSNDVASETLPMMFRKVIDTCLGQ